jgi:hypothetical protein
VRCVGLPDADAQPHMPGEASNAQMRCVFLTPSGFTLFGRGAKTVAMDKGEAEELGRIAALRQRLADGSFRSATQVSGVVCAYTSNPRV